MSLFSFFLSAQQPPSYIVSLSILDPRAVPVSVTNNQLSLTDSSLDYLFSGYNVHSFEKGYPLADNYTGPDAEYLQSIYFIRLNSFVQPQQLALHLQQNASNLYSDVFAKFQSSNFSDPNSTVDLTNGSTSVTPCYSNDPLHSPDDWWALDEMCLPELFCEQTADPSLKVAIIDIGYQDIFNNPDISSRIIGTEIGYPPNSSIFSAGASNHGLATALAIGAIHDNNIGIVGSGTGVQLILFQTSGFGYNENSI